jgi:hypothetical protein
MKDSISNRQLFTLAFGLLLLTNIVVFAGVAYNRFGEQKTLITLTERELKSPYMKYKENSGLSLRINWRVLSNQLEGRHINYSRPFLFSGYNSNPEWLDRNKLEQLGFDSDIFLERGDYYDRRKVTIPKEVYLVLEFDGNSYQEALSRAQRSVAKEQASLNAKPEDEAIQKRLDNAKRWLQFEQIEASRLFAVDAGLDLEQLRVQYSNQNKYIFVKGLVTTRYYGNPKVSPNIAGHINRLSVDSIHVPVQYRKLFEETTPHPYVPVDGPPRPPRFAVELVYGSRLEPWIAGAHKLSNEEP